jgi:hypothetical protein
MHIKPLPLGAILLGIGFASNAFFSPVNQLMRDPVWFMQNWRGPMKGAIGWFIAGMIFLVGGVVAWITLPG